MDNVRRMRENRLRRVRRGTEDLKYGGEGDSEITNERSLTVTKNGTEEKCRDQTAKQTVYKKGLGGGPVIEGKEFQYAFYW